MPIIAASDDLVTAEDLADLPGAPFSESVVAMVCDAIRAECGWHIAPVREETITVDGSGGRALMLRTLHLVDVTAASENGTALASDAYDWSESGYILRDCGWTDRPRGVQLTIRHGLDACPAGLAAVIGSLCAVVSSNNPTVASETAGGVSVSYRDLAAGLGEGERLAANSVIAKYALPPRP